MYFPPHTLMIVLVLSALAVSWTVRAFVMPGSALGREASPEEAGAAIALEAELRRDIHALANEIGPRHHWRRGTLAETAAYLRGRFAALDYHVTTRSFPIPDEAGEFSNIEVEIPGIRQPDEVLVVGAHYDSVPDSPGADDNATGIAAVLAIAGALRAVPMARTVKIVAFANEEEPYSGTVAMGSENYAQDARTRGENIIGMLALESIGYFRDEAGTQNYPPPLSWWYPDKGNFLAFVGNVRSRSFLRSAIKSYRRTAVVPSEGLSLPVRIAPDIARSDHAPFWRAGFPAIMVTDTVPFRNPNYHRETDRPETLDFKRLSLAVQGLTAMVKDLAGPI